MVMGSNLKFNTKLLDPELLVVFSLTHVHNDFSRLNLVTLICFILTCLYSKHFMFNTMLCTCTLQLLYSHMEILVVK